MRQLSVFSTGAIVPFRSLGVMPSPDLLEISPAEGEARYYVQTAGQVRAV